MENKLERCVQYILGQCDQLDHRDRIEIEIYRLKGAYYTKQIRNSRQTLCVAYSVKHCLLFSKRNSKRPVSP